MSCIINLDYNSHIDISKAKLTNVRKLLGKEINTKYIEIEFDNNFWIDILDIKEHLIDETIKNIPEKIETIKELHKNKRIDIKDFINMIIN